MIGAGDQVTIGALRLSFSQTDHPVTTLAARIDGGGRSLGYSADSGPGWELAALGPGLDVALCEATFLSDKEGSVQHLSARQAGRTARAAAAPAPDHHPHQPPGRPGRGPRRGGRLLRSAKCTVATVGDEFEV